MSSKKVVKNILIEPAILKREKTLVPKKFIPYIISSKIESLDIDDKEDYILAKKFCLK